MKFKLQLTSNVEIPNETKYVLLYTKKSGETKVYPIAKIINQNHKYLRADIIGSGPRTFINSRIITLNPVES